MSTNREFLKEAIADAKTVKETAIANAKLALEESFEPYLKQVLALKLEEMENADIDENENLYEEEILDEAETDIQEEFNLEEILAELEEESLNESEEEPLDEAEGEEEEEEKDESEMSDEELKDLIEDVIRDMVENGEIEPGEEFESEEGEEGEEDEELGFDVEDDEMGLGEGEDLMEKKEEEKDELEEALETISILRSELNEVNLLNAKLLYVNKIFKAKNNLSENQKLRVLGAFDKATNVKEVKLVYESINEHLKPSTDVKTSVNESIVKSASKVLKANPKNVKQPIVESSQMVARFQKLAGIIKN